MVFQLYQTTYEACMTGGCRDDIIQRAFAIRVQSMRGQDVALAIQYNDAVIFDCITSTVQNPMKMPLKRDKKDMDKTEAEIEWEQTEICKGGKMVRVFMFMDPEGSLYWLMKYENDIIRVIRHNPNVEMGDENYFKKIFEFRSEKVYFFLFNDNKFYLMDQSRKIKVLKIDPIKDEMFQESTLELPAKDREQILHVDFDEYMISSGCLHWNDQAFYLIDSKARDNDTWLGCNLFLEGFQQNAGPRRIKNSGLGLYQISFDNDNQQTDDGPVNANDKLFFKIGASKTT